MRRSGIRSMKKIILVPDVAYLCKRENHSHVANCRICDGNSEIEIKGKRFVCPNCNGSGRVYESITKWDVVGPAQFMSLKIKNDGETTCEYKCSARTLYNNLSYYDVIVDENSVFATEEEALSEANRRNAMESVDDVEDKDVPVMRMRQVRL